MQRYAANQQARRQAGPLLFLALSAAAILILRPTCPIHTLTGLLCPGCGATRAFLALIHAHPAEAFHQNPLFTLLLPFLLLYAAASLRRRAFPPIPTPILTSAFSPTAAFTLYLNL